MSENYAEGELSPAGLAAYMRGARDEKDWHDRCQKVKEAHGGDYPDFWWQTIIVSGLMDEVMGAGASEIKIYSFGHLRDDTVA